MGTTAQPKDPLVWIDCGTASLDMHKGASVEAGVVIIDADLKVVDKGIDILIKPPVTASENMNDFTRNMHTTSSLLDELEGGLSLEEVTG